MFPGYEFVAIALFIAVVAGMTRFAKRARWNSPIRLTRKTAPRREMEALGRLALGHNQSLTLVRVRESEYMVACGPGCINIQRVESERALSECQENAA